MKKITKSGAFALLATLSAPALAQLSDADREAWMQAQQRKAAQAMRAAPGPVSSGAAATAPEPAADQDKTRWMPDLGKLTATGGVIQVEGAGGGGLTPWALITGYGTRDSYGANAHYTYLSTQDYTLKSYGVAVGILDRLELSLSKQEFYGSLAPLADLKITQDIVGIKLKLAGDAVYDQDRWLPQIAVGAMFKHNNGIGGLGTVTSVRQLGAASDAGSLFLSRQEK